MMKKILNFLYFAVYSKAIKQETDLVWTTEV